MGFGGAIHAAMAPFATKMIDVKAYGGQDVRKMISEELRTKLNKGGAKVCDLCCGVGISTRALGQAFHDAELIVGVDTSPEMISMAKAISGHEQAVRSAMTRHHEGLKNLLGQKYKAVTEAMTVIDTDPYPDRRRFEATYSLANAENTDLPDETFHLVTIMYAFHEVPKAARSRIIQEAKRLLKVGGTLAVVDISPKYTPSKYMLAGEPFVIEYQQNIDKQLESVEGFKFSKRKEIVPGHVNMWLLTAK
jgi:ubiquinone/menaquinone biosynthesis C-methylase UbiE